MGKGSGLRRNLIGLQGEYAIGNLIMSSLPAIYRAQPFGDLGIDGEIELLDENAMSSTGRLLKVQVKTSIAKRPYVHVSAKHVDYWKLLSIPVIVCFVALKENRVCWWPWQAGVPVKNGYSFATGCSDIGKSYKALLRLSKPKGHSFDIFSGLFEALEMQAGYFSQLPPIERSLGVDEFSRHIDLAEAFKKVIVSLAKVTTSASSQEEARVAIARIDEAEGAFARMRAQAMRDAGGD